MCPVCDFLAFKTEALYLICAWIFLVTWGCLKHCQLQQPHLGLPLSWFLSYSPSPIPTIGGWLGFFSAVVCCLFLRQAITMQFKLDFKLLCSPRWAPNPRNPPAAASRLLILQACTTIPDLHSIVIKKSCTQKLDQKF